MALVSLLLLFILTVNSALSARIAGFHITGGSQYINTRHTLEELATRGHEVEKTFDHCCIIFFNYPCMHLSSHHESALGKIALSRTKALGTHCSQFPITTITNMNETEEAIN